MTRARLACGDVAPSRARQLTRDWCRDRALNDSVSEDMTLLAGELVADGLRLTPRSAVMELTWDNLDHARVNVEFRGVRVGPVSRLLPTMPRASVELFERLASDWGRQATPHGVRHWFVFDTESDTGQDECRSNGR